MISDAWIRVDKQTLLGGDLQGQGGKICASGGKQSAIYLVAPNDT